MRSTILLLFAIVLLAPLPVCRAAKYDAPQPIEQAVPEYPQSMKDQEVTGTVVFLFKVGVTGSVEKVFISKSPHRDLSEEVARVVKTWRFTPGKKNGKVTALAMRGRISFVLQDIGGGRTEANVGIDGGKESGEPGATDNPDNARRN